ncbi:hypothetical protein [Undibacterium sp. Jales W-56]|nr:hypothetical protein [Undibacterium sp. Jales W-56]
MKFNLVVFAIGTLIAGVSFAQTPAPAPASTPATKMPTVVQVRSG